LWLANNGLQRKKLRKSEKQRKKVSFSLGRTPCFSAKPSGFLEAKIASCCRLDG
jgi:hypothetical protein